MDLFIDTSPRKCGQGSSELSTYVKVYYVIQSYEKESAIKATLFCSKICTARKLRANYIKNNK